MDNVTFMRQAKQQLAGNWGNLALATLIYLAISGLAGSTFLGIILTGPLAFGYYLYTMCVADTGRSDLNLLFKGFERFGDTLVAGLLITLAVSVGLIFLIVPGIIIGCGFSMTYFIMAEDKNISGIDAMQRSWAMMNGHKWDFFCLNCRFIGWLILCLLTVGILSLWVEPYMVAAYYNFYRAIRSAKM